MKSIRDISLNITEQEYREMPELSYSLLAKYERGGFNSLSSLFDKVESPSLLYGSMVDVLVTGSQEEFDSLYMVADFPDVPDSIVTIVKALYNEYSDKFYKLDNISTSDILAMANYYKYQSNWKPETRVKVIIEKGSEYYSLLHLAENKTVVSTELYNEVLNAVDALKTSESTKWYFAPNNPFDNIERQYQLKFKSEIDGVGYRIMMDECIVNHNTKTIIPIDLKTSGKKEWDFHKSFKEWGYWWQGLLYTRVLEDNLKKDDYFKDFKVMPYIFIVVNKHSLTPLVWEFEDNHSEVDLVYGKNQDIIIRHPLTIGKELKYYLDNDSKVPLGISKNSPNSLTKWLNTL